MNQSVFVNTEWPYVRYNDNSKESCKNLNYAKHKQALADAAKKAAAEAAAKKKAAAAAALAKKKAAELAKAKSSLKGLKVVSKGNCNGVAKGQTVSHNGKKKKVSKVDNENSEWPYVRYSDGSKESCKNKNYKNNKNNNKSNKSNKKLKEVKHQDCNGVRDGETVIHSGKEKKIKKIDNPSSSWPFVRFTDGTTQACKR